MKLTEREKAIYQVTWAGSFVNFLLVIFKFIAGILGHSAAMIADAVHSLSDFATDIVVLIFTRISNKPQDKNHDYGHGKYETLATAIIGIVLFAVGASICWNGLQAIQTVWQGGRLPAPGMLAFAGAIISIVSKELIYRYTIHVGRKINSSAVIANAWHHRSDAFSSIGTAIGIGGAIVLGESWSVLDPMAAVVVSFFIMKVAVQLLKPCVDELTEKSLPTEVSVVNSEKYEKKYRTQKFKLDSGIEISIPVHVYQDLSKVEFVNNADGTITLMIKDIASILNKFNV